MVEFSTTTLLQIYCCISWWKNL